MSFLLFAVATAMSQVVLLAQASSDAELARLLADETTRQSGISRIVSSGSSMVPLLVAWTQEPPTHVDKHELFVGLADAFGQLKTREAIPFLVNNISLQRWRELNTWLKTAQVIEQRLPAAAALVRMGPDASKVVMSEYHTFSAEDRLAAIFVVARIRDPAARAFLSAILGQANLERYWAEEGLKRLDER